MTLSLKSLVAVATLTSMVALSGCSLFNVYKIDIAQGTPITQTQAQKIVPGMSQGQVLYYLGTPALRDTLAPNRWDYLYDYEPGTDGKRDGKQAVHNSESHFVVYFDEDSGVVTRTEGEQTLPVNQ